MNLQVALKNKDRMYRGWDKKSVMTKCRAHDNTTTVYRSITALQYTEISPLQYRAVSRCTQADTYASPQPYTQNQKGSRTKQYKTICNIAAVQDRTRQCYCAHRNTPSSTAVHSSTPMPQHRIITTHKQQLYTTVDSSALALNTPANSSTSIYHTAVHTHTQRYTDNQQSNKQSYTTIQQQNIDEWPHPYTDDSSPMTHRTTTQDH